MHKTAAEQQQAFEQFGLTNNPVWHSRAIAYRTAAVADGWIAKDDTNEHFTKDGWTMHVLSRDEGEERRGFYRYHASVTIWAPDRLQIMPPDIYDWQAIQAGIRTCNYCHKTDVETERVGFAGRSCADCLPARRAISERPGWTR